MKLFWCPRTRALRALWMIKEVGVEFDLVTIDIRDQEAERDPEFAAASPMGKVPALVDGEVQLAESGAICLYLADRYASERLAPALDSPNRGKFLYWMFFVPAVLEPAMSEKFSGAETNRFQNGWGDFDAMITVLEEGLADKTWLIDNAFSAADVLVGSSVSFLRQFGMLPESPDLQAYADRCEARPEFLAAQAMESD